MRLRFASTLLFGLSLVLAGACTSDSPENRKAAGGGNSAGATSGTGSGTGGSTGGSIGTGGTSVGGTGPGGIDPGKDATVQETSMCVTCNPPNGQYCGTVGNGCGATIHCGR
jgi:hypothetical protein